MKVNIAGVGLVPKVGLLAPVYGKDLTKDAVAVILNYSSFRVYEAASGTMITKTNIDEVFNPPVSVRKPPKKETTKPEVAKTPDKIETVSPVVEETTNDVEFEPLPEITEDPVTEESVSEPITVEENEEKEAPSENNNGGNNNYHNKKNKKRH